MSASYPSAVKAFATRAAGQTIDPSHVNELQDEVTAIEAGITQGTAPVTSSRITATALNITGSSTLAALVIPSTGRVGCRLTQSANVAVGAGATVGVSWDGEDFDVGGLHSTAVNSSQIALPRLGPWMVGAYVTWSPSTSGGYRDVRVVLNDAAVVAMQRGAVQGLGANTLPQSVSAIINATALTDYVTIVVSNDAGSTQSIAATNLSAWAGLIGA